MREEEEGSGVKRAEGSEEERERKRRWTEREREERDFVRDNNFPHHVHICSICADSWAEDESLRAEEEGIARVVICRDCL